MSADLSRVTFNPAKHFSAVLAQQGRVQLDADSNEQAAIVLHYLRTVVSDLVGPAGAPAGDNGGFLVGLLADEDPPSLSVSRGRMYVDGILVENDRDDVTYWNQPDGYLDPDRAEDQLPAAPLVAYLRVWEQVITALEDPEIREVALGDLGPDTAARTRVVWQVAATELPDTEKTDPESVQRFLTDRFRRSAAVLPALQAQAQRPEDADADVCDVSPEARYRGDNRLYRVEVHTGGTVQSAAAAPAGRGARARTRAGAAQSGGAPTFKWSRENASVQRQIASLAGAQVELGGVGRDSKLGFDPGDWVEIVDSASTARLADDLPPAAAPRLRRIIGIDPDGQRITLDGDPDQPYGGAATGTNSALYPLLRRWDHRSPTRTDTGRIEIGDDGALPIVEGVWIHVEDGVQIRFAPPTTGQPAHTYRAGDHWLIPARAVTGDVVWPRDEHGPMRQPPHGVEYHYAALGFVPSDGDPTDLRRLFPPLVEVATTAEETAPDPEPPPVAPVKRAGRRRATKAGAGGEAG